MLTLDLNTLSEAKINAVLAEYCSYFGSATILSLQGPDQRSGHGAAAVRMATDTEADELAKHVGGTRCGSKVIIELVQQRAACVRSPTRIHLQW